MPPHRQLSRPRPSQHHLQAASACVCAAAAQCVRGGDDDYPLDDDAAAAVAVAAFPPPSQRRSAGGDPRLLRYAPSAPPLEDPPPHAPHRRSALDDDLRRDYDPADEDFEDYVDDMNGRQRRVYETAFDCKISRSDDDLDAVDRVTNHPILQGLSGGGRPVRPSARIHRVPSAPAEAGGSSYAPHERRKPTFLASGSQQRLPTAGSSLGSSTVSVEAALARDLQALCLGSAGDAAGRSSSPGAEPLASAPPPLRGYSPSPPSTAPLPAKFHGKDLSMSGVRSAPDLPAGSPAPPRLKDRRLPIKSSRGRIALPAQSCALRRPLSSSQEEDLSAAGGGGGAGGACGGGGSCGDRLILEFKGRPPLRRRCRAHKYSSTESMATSSSGGSLESIRSSTSEGNRSTTSSDSRRSSSLSTHSSDSAGSCHGGGGGGGGRVTDPHHLHHFYHHHQCGGGVGATGGRGSGSGSRFFAHQATKLHILSPISDKSQEPASETSDNNRNNNSLRGSPEDTEQVTSPAGVGVGGEDAALSPTLPLPSAPPIAANGKGKRRAPQNKNLINLALQQQSSGEAEIQGSDSGISIESRGGGGGSSGGGLRSCKSCSAGEGSGGGGGGVSEGAGGGGSTDPSDGAASAPPPAAPADFADLPFDMPKLRRRQRLMPQDTCTSGSATSVDLYDLPFDMPKLRRRLRAATSVPAPAVMVGAAVQTGPLGAGAATARPLPFLSMPQPLPMGGNATDSSGVSHTSSSQSVRDGDRPSAPPGLNLGRASLTLNLGLGKNIGGNLSMEGSGNQQKNMGLCLNLTSSNFMSSAEIVDISVPLERQEWYHGAVTRLEAENILRLLREGSYLVRNSESTRQDYSLSLKSARGFMHMRIQQNKDTGKFILGQFSKPFDSIPEMIHHYTINRLPIRGAEHMCLLHPVMEQLL